MTTQQKVTLNRYARYQRVLEIAIDMESVCLDQLKRECADERPAFVTRVVRQLEESGWVVRESDASSETYHWNPQRCQFSMPDWLNEKIFGASLPNSPAADRPRERLMTHGASQLRTAELLAILIRVGRPGESALQAGERIAARFADQLHRLPISGPSDLKSISSAVSQVAYCQIMAGIELGRRVAERVSDQTSPTKISGSDDAARFCQHHFARLAADGAQEEFHIVCLDTKHQVIRTHQVTVGTLNASLVHPREVFRSAIQDSAASIILVHNHPSGDPTPSEEDLEVTTRLEDSGHTLGIHVLDHIILGRETSVSVREYRTK